MSSQSPDFCVHFMEEFTSLKGGVVLLLLESCFSHYWHVLFAAVFTDECSVSGSLWCWTASKKKSSKCCQRSPTMHLCHMGLTVHWSSVFPTSSERQQWYFAIQMQSISPLSKRERNIRCCRGTWRQWSAEWTSRVLRRVNEQSERAEWTSRVNKCADCVLLVSCRVWVFTWELSCSRWDSSPMLSMVCAPPVHNNVGKVELKQKQNLFQFQ